MYKKLYFGISLLLPFLGFSQAPIQWDNDSGDNKWETASNWSTDQVPTATDNVLLISATVTIGSDGITNAVGKEIGLQYGSSNVTVYPGSSLTTSSDLIVSGVLF